MSESSESKTKRNILHHLSNYEWVEQASLFPRFDLSDWDEDTEIGLNIVIDSLDQFRDKLRKSFIDTSFLCILRVKIGNDMARFTYGKNITSIYFVIYASKALDKVKLQKIVDSVYPDNVDLLPPRKLSEGKLIRTYNAFKVGKLHNLNVAPNKPNKRWTVLNQRHLIKRKIPISTLAEESL